ncbi:head decoration protein [Rhodopila sp.]|uniref:head decoration protein n=1 Tax=Rhodopila sp. TaxID=2480087 RepID=UPI003D1203E5
MALTPTVVGDNPFIPGVFAETYVPDQLIAGNFQLVTQPIIVASGAVALARGTVLGQITSYGVVATPGANTGNGTVGSITTGTGAELGNYFLSATSPTVFTVHNPEGVAMANATVGTAYSASGIGFTITGGGTAFVAGDSFTLASTDAVGSFTTCVKNASDGSQTPVAILVDYANPVSGAVTAGAYLTGEFNSNAVIFDASWTIDLLTTALRPYSIFLKPVVSAADPK